VWPNKNPYIGAGGFCPLFRCFRVFDGRLVEEPVTARRWTSRSSSERLGLPHFLHTSDFCSQILRLRWQWQLKVPAALRVRFLRAARDLHAGCSACPDWSLQKLFKRGVPAQGESPAPRSWKRRATRSRRVVYDDASSPTRYVPCVTVFRSLGTHWVARGLFCPVSPATSVAGSSNNEQTRHTSHAQGSSGLAAPTSRCIVLWLPLWLLCRVEQ
jgi:hypothetical protein